jgi:hypothetical protein
VLFFLDETLLFCLDLIIGLSSLSESDSTGFLAAFFVGFFTSSSEDESSSLLAGFYFFVSFLTSFLASFLTSFLDSFLDSFLADFLGASSSEDESLLTGFFALAGAFLTTGTSDSESLSTFFAFPLATTLVLAGATSALESSSDDSATLAALAGFFLRSVEFFLFPIFSSSSLLEVSLDSLYFIFFF